MLEHLTHYRRTRCWDPYLLSQDSSVGTPKKNLRAQVLGPSNYYPRNQVLGPLNYYLRIQVLEPLNYYLRNQVLRPSIYYPKTTSRTRANFLHYWNSKVAILINYSIITSEIRVTFTHYRNSIVGILKPLSQYHLRNSIVRKLNLVSQNSGWGHQNYYPRTSDFGTLNPLSQD